MWYVLPSTYGKTTAVARLIRLGHRVADIDDLLLKDNKADILRRQAVLDGAWGKHNKHVYQHVASRIREDGLVAVFLHSDHRRLGAHVDVGYLPDDTVWFARPLSAQQLQSRAKARKLDDLGFELQWLNHRGHCLSALQHPADIKDVQAVQKWLDEQKLAQIQAIGAAPSGLRINGTDAYGRVVLDTSLSITDVGHLLRTGAQLTRRTTPQLQQWPWEIEWQPETKITCTERLFDTLGMLGQSRKVASCVIQPWMARWFNGLTPGWVWKLRVQSGSGKDCESCRRRLDANAAHL